MRFLKTLPGLIVIAAFLIIAALAIWSVRGGCDAIKGYFDGKAVKIENPPPPEDVGIPVTAEPVPVIEDRKTFEERLTFWVGDTRAEELTKDLPAGTEVYVVTDPDGGQTVIYRTEEGYVYKEGEGAVEAFRTPEPLIAAEFRPVVGGYAGNGVGPMAGVDLIRVYGIRSGPRVAYDATNNGWSGGIGAGYNIVKNIDVGGYVGYGEGVEFGGTVTIAID